MFSQRMNTISKAISTSSGALLMGRQSLWVCLQATGMGKLLVFGGLSGSDRNMFIEDLLNGNYQGLYSLDDLW
jgi:hypothetical protein